MLCPTHKGDLSLRPVGTAIQLGSTYQGYYLWTYLSPDEVSSKEALQFTQNLSFDYKIIVVTQILFLGVCI